MPAGVLVKLVLLFFSPEVVVYYLGKSTDRNLGLSLDNLETGMQKL